MEIKDKILQFANKYSALFQKHNIKLSVDEPQKFSSEAKLADGTMIVSSADAWGEGVDVMVQNADGTTTALAAGDYELETGQIMSVDAEGKVVSIKDAAPAEPAEMSSEDAIAMIAALNERITELETANATLSADKDKAVTELATTKTQLSEKTAEVLKLKKLPVTTSVTEQFGKEKEKVDDAPKSGSREYFKSLIAKQQAN
jgi:hypothetical protein